MIWRAAVLFVCAFTLGAQQDTSPQDATGVGEFTAFAGGVFGIGSHPSGGVAFASPTSRHIVPNLEFAVAGLGSYDFRSGDLNRTVNLRRSTLYDLNGSIQVRFPNRTHMLPYFGVGAGLLRFTNDVESAGPAGNVVVHGASNYLAGNFSGGARYYITDHLGVRPEIKGYISNKNFVRFSVGIFYQFP